jgi:transitional endoplasmic reticulum ATPase
MSEIILKIDEIPQQHVGRGRAIVDPKIIEDQKWNSGQILELTYNKKTHVKLWPGSTEEYGSGIIKVDGITRLNIGAGIGDKISIKSVEAVNAEQIILSPTEKLPIDEEQLHNVMIANFQNHVFTVHDSIQLPTQMGGKIQFITTSTKPSKPVIVTENTIFKLGSMTKAIGTSSARSHGTVGVVGISSERLGSSSRSFCQGCLYTRCSRNGHSQDRS